MKLLPVIRYFLFVGSVLLAGIWWIGHDTAGTAQHARPEPQEWTELDSLRAIAHHGDHATRSAALFPRRGPAPPPTLQASNLSTAKPVASPALAKQLNAYAEVVGSNEKMAKAKIIKRHGTRHYKRFAQHRHSANTRIAAADHPAPVFFGFPIFQY